MFCGFLLRIQELLAFRQQRLKKRKFGGQTATAAAAGKWGERVHVRAQDKGSFKEEDDDFMSGCGDRARVWRRAVKHPWNGHYSQCFSSQQFRLETFRISSDETQKMEGKKLLRNFETLPASLVPKDQPSRFTSGQQLNQ